METNDFKTPATRKLRLAPLPTRSLPAHPSLPGSTTAVPLRAFVIEVLNEGLALSDSVIPTTFANKGSPKVSAPAAAKVQLLSSDLIEGETWFARRSEHENVAKEGTASYAEFEQGLFRNHSVNEGEYTPDIFDAFKVLHYGDEVAKVGEFQGWRDVEVELFEMCHSIPSPLDNRIFSTLVVRGKDSPMSFVVAQIPVDLSKVPAAMYSTGRNQKDGDTAQKRAKVTVGQYVSVERVKVRENGDVMWEMATASDAKGNLPMMLQKMSVPGTIVKDVGFVMKWTAERRGKAIR